MILLWPRYTNYTVISYQLSVLVRVTTKNMKISSMADTDMVGRFL